MRAKSYVYRSYRGKNGREPFCPPPTILNRVKVKPGYKLELLSPETMKLIGNTKKDVDKNKDGEDAPKLESVVPNE